MQLCSLLLTVLLPLSQPLAERMATTDVRIDSTETSRLYFELDNLSFLKDNEFSGTQVNGYTLPGLWVQPRLTWQPLKDVRLSAGLHATIFDGASKYPCYAYHDIGTWKGSQYQSGAHLLPFFRAEMQLGRTNIILGDIYGGANHRLVEPLFSPEVNLTQDPEMGAQVVVSNPHYWLDVWINWQSYIFEESTHQEAFTLGLSQRITLGDADSPLLWYIPLNVLGQHRGGEQDATSMGVQTLINGGVGVGMQHQTKRRVVTAIGAEAGALCSWQQAGHLWPHNTGAAAYGQVDVWLWRDLRLFGQLLYGHHFVTLYGSPFFSCLSQQQSDTSQQDFRGLDYGSIIAPHIGAEWGHSFGRGYELGIKADVFPVHADKSSTNFSFGLYMRCNPKLLIGQR